MNPVETFWCEGANGDKVQSILVKPPFFDPNKKYPMIFLIHGGPQGAWEDNFHYRWNLQMFAGGGYVVVAVNPREVQPDMDKNLLMKLGMIGEEKYILT